MKQLSTGCIFIIRKLYFQRRIGGKHIPEIICLKWIKHLQKLEHRMAIKDWEYCIKEGLVLTKPTLSGKHAFLNPRRLQEICAIINL